MMLWVFFETESLSASNGEADGAASDISAIAAVLTRVPLAFIESIVDCLELDER